MNFVYLTKARHFFPFLRNSNLALHFYWFLVQFKLKEIIRMISFWKWNYVAVWCLPHICVLGNMVWLYITTTCYFFSPTRQTERLGKQTWCKISKKPKEMKKKEQIKFIKGNPVRIRAVYSHQASVRHDVFCFKVKKKRREGCILRINFCLLTGAVMA